MLKNIFLKRTKYFMSTKILLLILVSLRSLSSIGQAGSLDLNFGTSGKVITDVGGSVDYALCTAVQPDGKVWIAGPAFIGGNFPGFGIVRYLPNGKLDSSFNIDGKVTSQIALGGAYANSIAIQSNGQLVLGGNSSPNSSIKDNFLLVRYTSAGYIDQTFNGGIVSTSRGCCFDAIQSIIIQPDDKILAAGFSLGINGKYELALVRYSKDGLLDGDFTSYAQTTTSFSPLNSDNGAYAIALQQDGKIIVAGRCNEAGKEMIGLARFLPTGALDQSFDLDGRLTTSFGTGECVARSVSVQADGKIVVAGYYMNGTTKEFALARYLANGTLDNSFDGDGKLTTSFVSTGVGAEARDLIIQPDGKILVAGTAALSTIDFALARYLSNGALDYSFDSDGITTIDFNGNDDEARGLELYGNRIYVGGMTSFSSGSVDFALAGLKNDITTAVANPSQEGGPTIFPVPAGSQLNILVKEKDIYLLKITDVTGRNIKHEVINASDNSSQRIDVSKLAAGMYYLHISGRKFSYSKTFVKQ